MVRDQLFNQYHVKILHLQLYHFPPELQSAGALRLGKHSLIYGLWIKYLLANTDWKNLPHYFNTVLRGPPHFNITIFLEIVTQENPIGTECTLLGEKLIPIAIWKFCVFYCIFIILIFYKRDHIKPYLLISRLIFHKTNKTFKTRQAFLSCLETNENTIYCEGWKQLP